MTAFYSSLEPLNYRYYNNILWTRLANKRYIWWPKSLMKETLSTKMSLDIFKQDFKIMSTKFIHNSIKSLNEGLYLAIPVTTSGASKSLKVLFTMLCSCLVQHNWIGYGILIQPKMNILVSFLTAVFHLFIYQGPSNHANNSG
jgi:hypothetical protein